MSRLLAAAFARLRKDKVFWIGIAVMASSSVFAVVSTYLETLKYEDYTASADSMMFIYLQFLGILTAAFVSLFIGTEYNDGTIRNKLVVGHNRCAVYFSNLITCIAAMVFISVSYMIPSAVLGSILLDSFQLDLKGMLSVLLGICFLVITFAAIVTMLSMLIQNKALVSVISLISLFILLFTAVYIASRLNEPEFYQDLVTLERIANPTYMNGTKREIYQFLFDFLPTGHAMELSRGMVGNIVEMYIYPTLITVVTTAIGIIGFCKKDLK